MAKRKIKKMKARKPAPDKSLWKISKVFSVYDIVYALTEMHIAVVKKDLWATGRYEQLREVAVHLGIEEAFDTMLKARPKVLPYSFTRITEEPIDVLAQSLDEAQQVAMEAVNRHGSTITLRRKRVTRGR